jgi:hypothetical protein
VEALKALPGGGTDSHAGEEELRALMVRDQAGEARAIDELVERLSPALLRYLSGPYRQASDAEDLLQESRLRIHRARLGYRPSEPVLPWGSRSRGIPGSMAFGGNIGADGMRSWYPKRPNRHGAKPLPQRLIFCDSSRNCRGARRKSSGCSKFLG